MNFTIPNWVQNLKIHVSASPRLFVTEASQRLRKIRNRVFIDYIFAGKFKGKFKAQARVEYPLSVQLGAKQSMMENEILGRSAEVPFQSNSRRQDWLT